MPLELAPQAPFVGPSVIAIVLMAAASDIQRRRIPNWLTFGAWLLACAANIYVHGLGTGILAWTMGWLTGFVLLLPFYMLRGMAAGDVKLMTAVGAWLGSGMALRIALLTFVLGGLWGISVAVRNGKGAQLFHNVVGIGSTGSPAHSVGSLPYGVAIAAGTVITLFMST
ncbi:prepilin peptidase [Cupriavidus sp. WKF15]|uniref:A24 family peptidase n=1 Tax=Cupriavidus sp. WKF15 TaxID=3032282 RepID=UPI0023E296BC|nr:prepilin peptidase [Cupriavidus sp. WKF15]WER46714.1 prepilin peptidase [Cupriavidus sp. WKF15]